MIYDISPPLHADIAVWPGDTSFSRKVSLRLDRGDPVELSHIRLSLHTGTHADAPCHFVQGGASIDELELEAYWGPARVATVSGGGPILPQDLEPILKQRPLRLLLRAHPGFDADRFPHRIRHLEIAAARAIGRAGVRLLGIDAPSVDPLESKQLSAHKELEKGGTRILENLLLHQVPDGEYELSALPLPVRDGDAAPVRAALRPIEEARESS